MRKVVLAAVAMLVCAGCGGQVLGTENRVSHPDGGQESAQEASTLVEDAGVPEAASDAQEAAQAEDAAEEPPPCLPLGWACGPDSPSGLECCQTGAEPAVCSTSGYCVSAH
jgi:hypothetical protein